MRLPPISSMDQLKHDHHPVQQLFRCRSKGLPVMIGKMRVNISADTHWNEAFHVFQIFEVQAYDCLTIKIKCS